MRQRMFWRLATCILSSLLVLGASRLEAQTTTSANDRVIARQSLVVGADSFTGMLSPMRLIGTLPDFSGTEDALARNASGDLGRLTTILRSNQAANITAIWSFSGTSLSIGNASTSTFLTFPTNLVNPPSSPTRSQGTRIVLFPNVGTNLYDFALGMEPGAQWFSLATSSNTWKFYANDTTRAAAAVPPQAANHVVAELTGQRVFMPGASYSGSLGLPNRKWLTLSAAELLVETLVAQDTLASTNGRQLIGASATVLTRDLAAGDTMFYVKHPFAKAFDMVLLETAGKVEWIRIDSVTLDCRLSCGDAPGEDYRYFVTRALDGSPANAFSAGDTIFNSGQTGDGFLDLYSQRSTISNGYAGYVLGDKPQQYYRMNGPTGAAGIGPNGNGDLTMLDSSGYGRTGSVPGGVQWYRNTVAAVGTTNSDPAFLTGGTIVPGLAGYFMVPRASLPNYAADLTLEFITYWDGTNNFSWLLTTAGTAATPIREFNVGISNGTVNLYFGDGTTYHSFGSAGCTLTANNYTHIAITRDASARQVICYKNGAQVGQGIYPASPTISAGTADLMVGFSFPGYVDELAIWNRVIPGDRIATHYARRTSNSTSTGNANSAGPSVAVMIRQSNTYNDIAPRALLGNLLGDYGFTTTTYGLALGDPNDANLIATGSKFAFRNKTVETLVMKGDSFAMGNPAPTALDAGKGLWFANSGGPLGVGTATFRVGDPAGNRVRWDGSDLIVKTGDLTIDNLGLTIVNTFGSGYSGSRGVKWDLPGTCDPYVFGYGTSGNGGVLDLGWTVVNNCSSRVRLFTSTFSTQSGSSLLLIHDYPAPSRSVLTASELVLKSPTLSGVPFTTETEANFDWLVQVRTGNHAGEIQKAPSGVLVNRIVNVGVCQLTFANGLLRETTCQ